MSPQSLDSLIQTSASSMTTEDVEKTSAQVAARLSDGGVVEGVRRMYVLPSEADN